jgi:hypothetical protein
MARTINMHTDLQISSCWEHISTWNTRAFKSGIYTEESSMSYCVAYYLLKISSLCLSSSSTSPLTPRFIFALLKIPDLKARVVECEWKFEITMLKKSEHVETHDNEIYLTLQKHNLIGLLESAAISSDRLCKFIFFIYPCPHASFNLWSGRVSSSCSTSDTRRVSTKRHEYKCLWKSC